VAFEFGHRFGEEGHRDGVSKVRSAREEMEEIDDDRIGFELGEISELDRAPSNVVGVELDIGNSPQGIRVMNCDP
jgi:hypothetical protein